MEKFQFSVKKAAATLAISETVLYDLMNGELIPYHHVGSKRVITCQALED